jgi:hypothetical protein
MTDRLILLLGLYSQEKGKRNNLIDQLSWIGQLDCFPARSFSLSFLVNTTPVYYVKHLYLAIDHFGRSLRSKSEQARLSSNVIVQMFMARPLMYYR